MLVKRFIIFILFIILSVLCVSAAPYYDTPTSNIAVQRDFEEYMQEVKFRLRKNWNPPDFMEIGHIKVLFKISRNGRILSLSVIESSGDNIYDESALEAVRKSAPFEKFPENTTREMITVNYTFDTTFVKTDKMKEYYQLSNQYFIEDKQKSLYYINLAIQEVQGDDEAYFLYKKRAKIKEAMGEHLSAKEDFKTYEAMKSKIDIKRIHQLKHQAQVEDNAYSYYYLAFAYDQIGDFDNAIIAINKAIERTSLNNQYKRYKMELIRKYKYGQE